jgi:deoxyribodipyrimidine photolyase-related protein
VPINSVEGFIRQIIGWREYMRMMYEARGTEMRTSNHWEHTQKISEKWYTGTTGLDPVDDVIRKASDTAYAHHIERLMVVGNSMFLCGIHPDEVYRWFMEYFIDAYDWVMVPNVYAMSQNTADGIITTKPYISGSNYIKKMSHYPDGEWNEIWDALYWDFLIRHEEKLSSNHRMNMMVSRVKKMSYEKKETYQQIAQAFRESLGGEQDLPSV